jgi:hypothetical protein
MENEFKLSKLAYDWWKKQLDSIPSGESRKLNVKPFNPSIATNQFVSRDAVFWDEANYSTWIRFGLNDHVQWFSREFHEDSREEMLIMNEFIPETNVYFAIKDYKNEQIPIQALVKDQGR